jgi:hypothetical protein
MYILEIDDILNETLNNFIGTWVLEENMKELLEFKKLIKEPNFIKYQKDINNILEFGQSIISQEKINKLVTKKQNIILINNVITKYLGYYLFILIGINYNDKLNLFNNNLIEFSRNQINYSLKIDNFFSTESNSNIIKIINIINEFLDFIKKSLSKDNNIKNYSNDLQNFFTTYGEDNIKKNIIPNLKKEKNKIIIDHSLIILMIQTFLYKDKEKNEIFDIIESTETANGDFIFIDVVVPRSDFIDYNAIESILSPEELKTNLPEEIYEQINEDYVNNINEKKKYFSDHDIKIQKLIDTHILIPIVDDILLYHKDNEKYEKYGDKSEAPKKKDETKIKYIINKINTVTDLYKNQNEIKKLFYVPLQEENAVLINNYEDVKILSKMKNIIKMNTENLDLLNDLINYRLYPYISFKDFKKNGFIFSSDKTVDVVRNVSFDYIKKNNILQTRIMSNEMLVNIVGFIIINKKCELDCANINSFIDITKETNDPLNAIKTLLNHKLKKNFLSKTLLETDVNELNNNYYWLFDLEKQKFNIPFYNISDTMPKNEVIKIITSYLYDYTIECVINIIKEKISISESNLITTYIDNIENIKFKYPDITNIQHSKEYNDLEWLIYYVKSIKVDDTYDYNEDEFPGLYGIIQKLPNAPPKKFPKIPVLAINTDFKKNDDKIINSTTIKESEITQEDYDAQDNQYVDAICQHTVTWDKIGQLKKMNDSKFSSLVYEFIQQYITINNDQDFICKSCKSAINISKYIQDGRFDNYTQNFVTFSAQMDINIEDLPEYEKFKTSIRNIDKIIERMASIFNLQNLKGSIYSIKIKRKTIVKDVIDIIISHNNYLKKNYLANRDQSIVKFGINKNLSNFFVFEIDNNIFIYSSKDKDYYKIIKYNNVIIYILILLIFELNDSQIIALTNDKICNYYVFTKIGLNLFDKMNIIINKNHDIKPITDYPILCYVIYLFSCLLTKYNIWIDILSSEVKPVDKKKFNPTMQKSIINTFIELVNTILTVDVESMKANKIYIYEILQTKYYFKLDIYKSTELIKKLDKMYLQITDNKQNNIISIDSNKFDILNEDTIFNKFYFDDLFQRFSKKDSLQRYKAKYYNKTIADMTKLSNLSNCIDGEFHDFKCKDKTFICERCNESANPSKIIPDSIKILYQRQIILYLRRLTLKYCIDGKIHNIENNKCLYCKFDTNSPRIYSDKELFSMYNIIEKNINNKNLLFAEYINKLKIKNSNQITLIKSIFDKLSFKFQKNDNDITKSVNIILDSIQKLLGIDIIINNKTYNLHYNIYYIDHDYNGSKLESPIQVYEKDNKFRSIENHPHYKRDVLVYSMQKNTKYELFYDLQEKYFLGYREINKEYNDINNTTIKLEINYSIKNMLLQFGLTRQQINIKDFYPEIIGMSQDNIDIKYTNNKHFLMNDFINKICARRFSLIKKLGNELNKYINRFKFNYNVTLFVNEFITPITNKLDTIYEPSNNPLDILYVKYKKKIDSDIITEITNNKHHVFLKYMNDILLYMPFHFKNSSNNEIKFSEFIDYNFILKNDTCSNIILNYIFDEFNRLINYNTNKTIKTNIAHFIVDIICILFNEYYNEKHYFDKNINYFNQVLYSSDFYLEIQNIDSLVDVIDYYSDQYSEQELNSLKEDDKEKIINEIDNDIEEAEALDIDDENLDEEGIYHGFSNYDYIDNIKTMISEHKLPEGTYY